METSQIQSMEQRLVLTQGMRQSLKVLQMELPELREYLLEQILPNPLIELEDAPNLPLPTSEEEDRMVRGEDLCGLETGEYPYIADSCGSAEVCSSSGNMGNAGITLENLAFSDNNFFDMLTEQLAQVPGLSEELRQLCEYLIQCLSDNGYLEFDLLEIAAELRVPLFHLEQALYVVQDLQPAGVGARTLEECLILQLAQGPNFNQYTIGLVKNGLPLLAKDDLHSVARLLGCSMEQAKRTAATVRQLAPIPARGYGTGERVVYQIPEAVLHQEGDQLIIEMNRQFLPRIYINQELITLLRRSSCTEEISYMKQQIAQAKQLIRCVEERGSTIERILKEIKHRQAEFFLHGKPLTSMTMSQMAADLGLSVSTVSRALQGKSISFRGKIYPLRKLFTNNVIAAPEGKISSENVKRQILRFIGAEDALHPLSDEKLRAALETICLPVSRRVITKYREELGFPASCLRKKGADHNPTS